jgi:hypothetical protein
VRRAEKARAERPLTAQPVGERFAVATRGLHHVRRGPGGEDDVSDNFVGTAPGCYRRLPTTRGER